MGVLVLLVAGVLIRLLSPAGFLFAGSIVIGAVFAVANVVVTAMISVVSTVGRSWLPD